MALDQRDNLMLGHATTLNAAPGPDWSGPLTIANLSLGALASKIVDPRPVGIRWLARPDGEMVLQFAMAWSKGLEHGVDWEDVPVVGGKFA